MLSLNFSGLEKDSSLQLTLPMLRMLLSAIYYGDLLVTLRAQTAPYEVERGAADALQEKWLNRLCGEIREGRGYHGREIRRYMDGMAADFAAIPVRRVPKVKVGVVGEIYVKYSPLGNNDLEKFLASQDCEVNLPGILGFAQYCAYNISETARLYGGSVLEKRVSGLALGYLSKSESVMIRALRGHGFHAPLPFKELTKLTDGIIGMGCKMGEGWLLTAEMIELVRAGYSNIVCAQPFGCLPNHICGKGMINQIRARYPEANITPIDYDPGATRVNQENRIKLMLAVARERLETAPQEKAPEPPETERRREPPAAASSLDRASA